jgi:hypothetical protein
LQAGRLHHNFAIGVLLFVLAASGTHAADPAKPPAEGDFRAAVQPFLKAYCLDCHATARQEAKLDLSGYSSTADVARAHRVWQRVLQRLEAGEMPPDDAPQKPDEGARMAVVAWLRALRNDEARRHAGDPGEVPVRRLSNYEIDCTVRDLTGVDIRPMREFPVDPANEAGFDNSGESLTTSPAWLKKYLAAARRVADHLVLKPSGIAFAPHTVVTDTDRDKYCVARIVDFYRRHSVDYAEYFFVAWRFNHREAIGRAAAALDAFAAEAGLSPKYAATIWSALTDPQEEAGPLAELRGMWRQLPEAGSEIDSARIGCRRMRDFVSDTRKQFVPTVDKLRVKGISDGSQPLVLWRNRRFAAGRMVTGSGDGTAARFCRTFPDAFYLAERPPYFETGGGTKGRLLTAGFHLMQGYFRDDQPLCELVLADEERQEIESLWQELNFITGVPARQYKDFIFFERAEPPRFAMGSQFDFARSEDKDATSAAMIEKLRTAYLAKAREIGASTEAIEAIDDYFTTISAEIRWVEQARLAAEPSHLAALEGFAERAYRRPLSATEREDLLGFYHALRDQDGLDHESALRDCVASLLISPYFCYRLDLGELAPGAPITENSQSVASQTRPLSNHEVASRLSYFLWSSMPDDELLAHAAAGDLRQPDVLLAQSRRMQRDGRVWGLATQFAGSFFDFRRFDEHNSVDRQRFPGFTNDLRQAMYEEPLRFFVQLAGENRPLLDLLYGDDTFVNPVLARHYGIPLPAGEADGWVHIDDARPYGRGGLLPMAAFLTRNSPGLRTSPVKRGYWVVSRLLGERIPAPPPSVPELPKDEAALGELTLSQLLARHRQSKNCAVCHDRFDSVGLVFEGYGPIGERRDHDLSGHPVSETAVFRDGSEGSGIDGLRDYLRRRRQDDFIENFCRKLLVYALGRSLLPSDELLVDNMRNRLSADDYRFGSLIEVIVTSPQFLTRRARTE